jgi:TPR repeat protein
MGMCHLVRHGFEKSYTVASEYFQKSSDLGNALGPDYLGFLYKNGFGVEKDIEKAFNFFGLAIERGYFNNVGEYFEYGKLLNKKMDYYKLVTPMIHNLKKNHKTSYIEKILKEILSQKLVEWETKLHEYWDVSKEVNEKIICILLISKHRKESSNKNGDFLVKGITINIIKYLCHFTQELKIITFFK